MSATRPGFVSQADRWRAKQGFTAALPTTRGSRIHATQVAAAEAKAEAAAAAEAHRANDLAECARRVLQQRGRVVYRASVNGGPDHLWVCTGIAGLVDDAALIAAADRISGGGDRIAAVKREDAMKALNETEAARLAERGTTKSRVLDDLAAVVAAAGTTPAAARRLGLSTQLLYNVKGGQQGISRPLFAALYGTSGCELRPELRVLAPVPWDVKGDPVPLAVAAREAALVADGGDAAVAVTVGYCPSDDELAGGAADDTPIAADDGLLPDDVFTDVGAVLERERDARAAMPVVADGADWVRITGGPAPETNATILLAAAPVARAIEGRDIDPRTGFAYLFPLPDPEPVDWKTPAIAALDARRQQVVAERDAARVAADARAAAMLAALDSAAALLIGLAA